VQSDLSGAVQVEAHVPAVVGGGGGERGFVEDVRGLHLRHAERDYVERERHGRLLRGHRTVMSMTITLGAAR
jgi:hypothetical protein